MKEIVNKQEAQPTEEEMKRIRVIFSNRYVMRSLVYFEKRNQLRFELISTKKFQENMLVNFVLYHFEMMKIRPEALVWMARHVAEVDFFAKK